MQNRVATPDSVRNGAAAILRTLSILSRAVAHPTIVLDAVRLGGAKPWQRQLFQIESERIGLVSHGATPDRLDRGDHAALAAEDFIGERDDPPVGSRGR